MIIYICRCIYSFHAVETELMLFKLFNEATMTWIQKPNNYSSRKNIIEQSL